MASPTCTVVDQQILAEIRWAFCVWGRKYHGSICNFAETLMFRVANVGKTQLSWRDGIWLGRDTESDMHFAADLRPEAFDGIFRPNKLAWNFCKASLPHHGILLVPRVKQMLSYFHFRRMLLSHCLKDRPRKTLWQIKNQMDMSQKARFRITLRIFRATPLTKKARRHKARAKIATTK